MCARCHQVAWNEATCHQQMHQIPKWSNQSAQNGSFSFSFDLSWSFSSLNRLPKKKHEKNQRPNGSFGFHPHSLNFTPHFCWEAELRKLISPHTVPWTRGLGLDPVMWPCCDTTIPRGDSNRRFPEFSSFVEQASCSNKNLAGKVLLWDFFFGKIPFRTKA